MQRQYKHFGSDFCCVPLCSNQRGRDKYNGLTRSYYKFPDDVRRKSLWLKVIRRGGGWTPKPWCKVCSDHFPGGNSS